MSTSSPSAARRRYHDRPTLVAALFHHGPAGTRLLGDVAAGLATTALLILALLTSPAEAIQLSQDFDSGSLDVPASTISGLDVNLVGRKNWTQAGYNYRYRWFYFRASDVAGLSPTFSISTWYFLGDLPGHRFVYSYDQENWSFFDYGVISSSTYQFYNAAAFTENDVYIAYSLPYPFLRTQEHMARVAASPFVSPTASGGGSLIVGRSAGGVDDSGRPVEAHDLYGYRITDATAMGPKRKVVLAGGNHSCEPLGNPVLEGAIDFLLSDDPEAVRLRRVAEFYVYPQVNPDGRAAGYYRSTPENPRKAYNRYWNNPAGFTDMTAVRDAMILDTGGDVDYLFDFHGMFTPTHPDYYHVYATEEGADDRDRFTAALAELEPAIVEEPLSGAAAGMLHIWAAQTWGLGAECPCVPEFGPHAGVFEDRLDEIGANYARALGRAIMIPEPLFVVLLLSGVLGLALVVRRRKACRR